MKDRNGINNLYNAQNVICSEEDQQNIVINVEFAFQDMIIIVCLWLNA